jgi:Uma2 family endonuclease
VSIIERNAVSATASTGRSLDGPRLDDLLQRFGPIPARRLRMDRYPATEQDVLDVHAADNRLCELYGDLLVEKPMGFREGYIALELGWLLRNFLERHDLGVANGADGMMKLAPGMVHIPDVSFIRWEQFPGRRIPATPIPAVYPDLAVEVLSDSNTPKEMEEKRNDYFAAGARLVWIVDPDARTLAVYTPADRHSPTVLAVGDVATGEPVLPGFSFVVGKLFEKLA